MDTNIDIEITIDIDIDIDIERNNINTDASTITSVHAGLFWYVGMSTLMVMK